MRNLSMVMDLYELTMANSYFKSKELGQSEVVFDIFFRRCPDQGGFAICAGLSQVIEYIQNLHFSREDIEYLHSLNMFDDDFLAYLSAFRFTGTIRAVPEGTVVYPNTPLMTVIAPLIDAQLLETALLVQVNHQCLVATKAQRIVRAAGGRPVADFGARRAHGNDSAVYGARAAYIGGVSSTATVLSGQMFDIPVTGTMAHSYVMFHETEYDAFRHYCENYPDAATLLVDTYDVLESGIPNAIRAAKEVLEPMGKRLKGVRLDSGDLAYLSKKVRKMLDDAGLTDCKVVASNSLDEFTIESLLSQQGARIDAFGVGERLITARSEPVFGGVYKLVAVKQDGQFLPKIKVSENVEKITNPGLKKLYRIYDERGFAIADLLTLHDEEVDMSQPYRYVNPLKPWKVRYYENCRAVELQKDVFVNGELVYEEPTIHEIRDFVRRQLETEIWEEEQRFINPHIHYLDMSPRMYETKMDLLEKSRRS